MPYFSGQRCTSQGDITQGSGEYLTFADAPKSMEHGAAWDEDVPPPPSELRPTQPLGALGRRR